jgi:hypothetical protein
MLNTMALGERQYELNKFPASMGEVLRATWTNQHMHAAGSTENPRSNNLLSAYLPVTAGVPSSFRSSSSFGLLGSSAMAVSISLAAPTLSLLCRRTRART